MREILFRGKRTYNGEWVHGIPIKTHIGMFIVFEENPHFCHQYGYMEIDGLCPVIPETVGQFTGMTDKNGKKIFEGDMLRMDDEDDCVGVIIFKDGCFRLEIHGLCGTWTESGFDECGGGYGVIECEPIDYWYIKDMEVIGNIHDNPELLKGEEK